MFVAVYHPHNEGAVALLIEGPGFESADLLVDTYEVDASVASFGTVEEAERWLTEDHDVTVSEMVARPGGRALVIED